MANANKVLEPEQIRHSDVSYERGDLSHHAVFSFFIALACAGLIIGFAIWGIFGYMAQPDYSNHQTTNPMMTSNEELKEIGGDPARSFPIPRLQPDPVADLNNFRIQQADRLNSYGWVDSGTQKIHIPIERAIDILGNSWPQAQQEAATTAPEASTGGNKNGAPGPMIKDQRKGNYGW